MSLPDEFLRFEITLATGVGDDIECVTLVGDDAWAAQSVLIFFAGDRAAKKTVSDLARCGIFGRGVSDYEAARARNWSVKNLIVERQSERESAQ